MLFLMSGNSYDLRVTPLHCESFPLTQVHPNLERHIAGVGRSLVYNRYNKDWFPPNFEIFDSDFCNAEPWVNSNAHYIELPLHQLLLLKIYNSLHRYSGKNKYAENVDRDKLNPLGHVGVRNANPNQSGQHDEYARNNQQKPSASGTIVVVTGLVGFLIGFLIFCHGLQLLFFNKKQPRLRGRSFDRPKRGINSKFIA
jgi:hypothetical protein